MNSQQINKTKTHIEIQCVFSFLLICLYIWKYGNYLQFICKSY